MIRKHRSLTIFFYIGICFVLISSVVVTPYNANAQEPTPISESSTPKPECFMLELVVAEGEGILEAITPQNCEGGYLEGTAVELLASPANGFKLSEWRGTNSDYSLELAKSLTIINNSSVEIFFDFETPIPAQGIIIAQEDGDPNQQAIALAELMTSSDVVSLSGESINYYTTSNFIKLEQLLGDPRTDPETRGIVEEILAQSEPVTWIDYTKTNYLTDNPGQTDFHFTIKYAPSTDNTHRPNQTDSDNDGTPDFVENLARYLEHGIIQFSYFGFKVPSSPTVKIFNLPSGTLGETGPTNFWTINISNQNDSSQLKVYRIYGTNPFSILGALRVGARKPSFGTSALQLTDFSTAAGNNWLATFSATPVSGWYNAAFSAAGKVYINRTGATQFRLYFPKDDNNDLGADIITFYSGNAGAATRPKLVIQYYVP